MLRVHDTREKKKVTFTPLVAGHVSMYACGVTVYDVCHVGHARMMIAFDVIARHLRASGFNVRFVRNITDVDDKIIRRGHTEGLSAADVAKKYGDMMAADLAALGVAPPDVEPRATQTIPEMLAMIGRLVDKGLAYASAGDVYFSVPDFRGYGAISGQSPDDLRSGARIEVGEQKRSPLDFALWKGAKPGEPSWPSAWGPGRPGWHIECSAMAHAFLGETFDIHGGGADLIFPHHENENAQSQGAFGEGTFARHWLHSGMVNFGGEKMSKSLGNVVSIRKVGESYDLEALRLVLVSVHYRSPLAFEIRRGADDIVTFPDLDEAEARLDYFYRTLERIDAFTAALKTPVVDPPASDLATRAREAMDDDFNTAGAIGHLYDAFVQANKALDDAKALSKETRAATLAAIARDARALGQTLGILTREPPGFLLARRERQCARRGIDAADVEARILARKDARASKNFARADEIRDALKAEGVELMDAAAGTTWRVV